jgi:hypothetical protein
MSKKNRRRSRLDVFQPTTSRPAATVEFNPDYSTIILDLRRIGILAGSFLVVMFVLAFFM